MRETSKDQYGDPIIEILPPNDTAALVSIAELEEKEFSLAPDDYREETERKSFDSL